MATKVSDPIRWEADQWENHCGYKSAVLSGIVPDAAHKKRGGYHCSVEDLRLFGNSGDYSNTRPDDRNLNVEFGAAIDMSMSKADMKLHHSRVYAVWLDRSDPRRQYFNAVNTWDGSGDAVRLDFYANTATRASEDHTWHGHGESRRRWLKTMKASQARVSVYKGESKASWLAAHPEDGPAPTPPAGQTWMDKVISNLPTLSEGSKGEHVQTAQTLLCARGVVGDANWKAYADADFGPKTTADVKQLQKMHSVREDGVIGPVTWAILTTGRKPS